MSGIFKTVAIKDIALITAAILSLTGFYFSTSMRLDYVEKDLAAITAEVERNDLRLEEVRVGIARIETKISGIEVTLAEISNTINNKGN